MPRNGSGTFVPPGNSWNPAQDGQDATSSDWNGLLSDIVQEITNSIAADGQTNTTSLIPFAQGIAVPAGALGAPLLTFIGDNASGVIQLASGQLTLVAAGTNVITCAANKLGFFGATPASKPTISGSRAANAALASLITQLATLGLVTDGTTA